MQSYCGMRFTVRSLTKYAMYVLMVFDHSVAIFAAGNYALRLPGRVCFPIFAGLVAHGMTVTSDRKKYIKRLWVLAAISQIPYLFALRIPFPNDIVYLLLIAIVMNYFMVKKPKNLFGEKEKTWKEWFKSYWLYAVYPLHLIVLGVLRLVIK